MLYKHASQVQYIQYELILRVEGQSGNCLWQPRMLTSLNIQKIGL